MRYSIIHHDVREQFGLSLHEYVVCDAIYQLSYHYGVNKSNAEMSKFLGIDRANMSRIQDRLLEKGLLTYTNAWAVSEKWTEAVTGVQNQQERARSTPPRAHSTQNVLPAHHSISNKDNELVITADAEKEPQKEKRPTRDLLRQSEKHIGRKWPNFGKQMNHIAAILDAGYSSDEAWTCFLRLEEDEYWSQKGYDWAVVASEIGKNKKKIITKIKSYG